MTKTKALIAVVALAFACAGGTEPTSPVATAQRATAPMHVLTVTSYYDLRAVRDECSAKPAAAPAPAAPASPESAGTADRLTACSR